MSAATLLAALAATGITYDWRPVDDAEGGHEYVVTVEHELMQAALAGNAKICQSNVPAEVQNVRRVRVVLGEGPVELAAESEMVPLRHEVARPDFDEQPPVKHSVYQQTYPPQAYPPQTGPSQNDLYQGFQQYNTAQAPRKSIGSELIKGGEKLVDGTGRVLRDGGEMIEGTARNVRDGFRSVLTPGASQPVAAAQPDGYQPYSYNQPTSTAPTYDAAPTYPPLRDQPGTPTAGVQQYNSPSYQNQRPGNQPGGAAPPNWTAANDAPSYNNQPGYTNQPQPTSDNRYHNQQSPAQQNTQQGSQAYVDLVDQRGNSAGAGDEMVNLRANPYRGYDNQPGQQSGYNNQPYQQPLSPNPNTTAGAGDTFGAWPSPPTTPIGQQSPAGGQQQANYGPTNNQQPGQDASGWGGSIDASNQGGLLPINGGINAGPQAAGQQNQPVVQPPASSSTWFPLVLVAAIGSIAWNFYLGMNYIDARNKYRAALRRSGKAYSEAFDDV